MKTLIAIIVIIIVAILGFWYFSGQETEPGTEETLVTGDQNSSTDTDTDAVNQPNSDGTAGTDAGMIDDGTIPSEAREFTIEGSNFKFTPNTITVQKDDLVRVIFKSTSGTHDFKLDEFEVAT